jgi:hypothetical protein
MLTDEFYLLGYKPCSPLNVNQCFGGTCRLNLQGLRVGQARNQYEADGKEMFL